MSTVTELSIPARDGYRLAATLHEPAGRPAAAAVIAAAMGVRQTYYQRFAAFLADHGVATLTFDYRGIGQSRPGSVKGFKGSLRDWGTRDVPGLIDWLASRYPESRRVFIGHSVGAQLLGLADNNQRIDRFVVVCAGTGDWRLWPGPRRYLLAALWHLGLPALTRMLGYFPAAKWGMGEDLPAGIALEWARWCRTPGYLLPFLGKDFPGYFAAFGGPVLAYRCADDRIAPARAADALLRMYSGISTVEIRQLEPGTLALPALGHFGFFRPGCASVWPEIAHWIGLGSPSPRAEETRKSDSTVSGSALTNGYSWCEK